MQKYFNNVTNKRGDALSGVSVSVFEAGTSTLATLYEDDETTTKTNPLATNSDGEFEFKAVNGVYDLLIARTGDEQNLDGVVLFDIDDTSITDFTTANNTYTGTNTYNNTVTFAGVTKFADDGELTISGGSINITGANHTVDTEADAASDDLDTILGGVDGAFLFVRAADDARTVVIKHNTGNIATFSGGDISLDDTDKVATFIYDAAKSEWLCTVTSVSIASQAEAQAGTNNTNVMTPLRTFEGIDSAFNVSGSAPKYACRAWLNFDGTGATAITASGNVSSVTDNGTGNYTINFTTAMPDADYIFVCGAARDAQTTPHTPTFQNTQTKSTSALQLTMRYATTNADVSNFYIAVFR